MKYAAGSPLNCLKLNRFMQRLNLIVAPKHINKTRYEPNIEVIPFYSRPDEEMIPGWFLEWLLKPGILEGAKWIYQ